MQRWAFLSTERLRLRLSHVVYRGCQDNRWNAPLLLSFPSYLSGAFYARLRACVRACACALFSVKKKKNKPDLNHLSN